VAENKTKPTKLSVAAYVAAIDDEDRRKDCKALIALMQKVTRFEPVMWGAGIVGFGSYHYCYDSGREGDSCLVGFAARKTEFAIYASAEFEGRDALLAKLGKFKGSKGCMYIKRLADVDLEVLAKLLKGSAAELRRRYPVKGKA
jgi:hypothetical protein